MLVKIFIYLLFRFWYINHSLFSLFYLERTATTMSVTVDFLCHETHTHTQL